MDKKIFYLLLAFTLFLGAGNMGMHLVTNRPLSDIAGPDLNADGVRDDVEAFIRVTFPDPYEQSAVMQYAKHAQAELLARDNPDESARLASDGRARGCMGYVFGNLDKEIAIREQMGAKTRDTLARRSAHDQYNRNIPGGVYGSPPETIDQCDFYQTEIVDWPTHSSRTIGVEFRYPRDWYVQERADTLSTIRVSNVEKQSELSDEALATEAAFLIQVEKNRNPSMLSLQEWYKRNLENSMSSRPTKFEWVAMGGDAGMSAIRIEVPGIGTIAHLYIARGVDIIEISYPASQPKFRYTYDLILATLNVAK